MVVIITQFYQIYLFFVSVGKSIRFSSGRTAPL